jgi:large subunit ribosomal protein L25
MSDQITLNLEKRDVVGKAVSRLRREGIVPAVIHDHGKPSINVSAVYSDLLHAYRQAGRHNAVKLTAGGKTYTAMIKTVELDPKKNTIKHVVFGAVSATEKIEAEVPVKPRYAEDNDSSPAERASLILIHNSETVQVEAVASKLPEVLEFDAEKLVAVGDRILASDLDLPSGVELKSDPDMMLVTVYEPSAVAAANDEAAGDASPEDAAAEAKVPADHDTTIQTAVVDEPLPGGKKEFPEDGNAKTAK